MVSNPKRYFTNYILKVLLIFCVVSVLFVVNSMLTKNEYDEINLRQPNIYSVHNPHHLKKSVISSTDVTSELTRIEIGASTTSKYHPKSNSSSSSAISKLSNVKTTSTTSKTTELPRSQSQDDEGTMSYMFRNFPWDELEERPKGNKTIYVKRRQSLIDKIEKFAYLEPKIPIDKSCHPPNLINVSSIDCSKYPSAFLPNKSDQNIKVGHAIQLGFDVDTLEIHLNEIYDVIDYFFIIESTRIHCESFRKQLTWDQVNTQARFNKFRDKVIHLVIDDSEYVQTKRKEGDRENKWALESLQERLRWEKIKEWNRYTRAFSDNDLIGFGDADEIASRENIQLMKHCTLKSGSIDIGIWFPFGRMDQAYKSDFPVSRYPYTLGDPTYFRWKDIDDTLKILKKTVPNRMRGKSKAYLLGGAHLSYYTFLPYFLLRTFSSSECGIWDKSRIKKTFIDPLEKGKGRLDYMESQFHKRVTHLGNKLHRIKDIKEDLNNIIKVPWFYTCNKKRYPSWQGKHDTRIT